MDDKLLEMWISWEKLITGMIGEMVNSVCNKFLAQHYDVGDDDDPADKIW